MENSGLKKSASEKVLHALLDEKNKSKNLEKKIRQLEEKISQLSKNGGSNNLSIKETSVQKLNELQEAYNKLKLQHQTMIVALTESEEESKALRGQQKSLKELIEKIKKDHQYTKDKCEDSERQVAILNNHVQLLKEDLKKFKELEESVKAYEEKNAYHVKKLVELYDKEKIATYQINQLRQNLSEKEKIVAQTEKLREEVKIFENQNDEMFNQIIELKQKNTKLEAACSELQKSNHEMVQGSEHLEKVMLYLREKNDELQSENGNLENESQKVQEELESLRREVKTVHEHFNETKGQLETEFDNSKNLQHQLNILQEELDHVKFQLNEKNISLEKQVEFNQVLKKDLELQVQCHEENKEKASFLENQIQGIDAQINQLKAERDNALSAIEVQETAISELKNILEEKNSDFASREALLNEEVHTLRTEKEQVDNENADKIRNLTEEVLLLKNLNDGHLNKIDLMHDEKSEFFKIIDEQNHVINKLQNNEASFHANIQELQIAVEEVTAEKNSLCMQVKSLKEIIDKEKNTHLLDLEKIELLTAHVKDFEYKNLNLKHEKEALINTIDSLNANIQELKGSIQSKESNYQREISSLKTDILELKDRELQFKNSIQSQEIEVDEIKQVLNVVTLQKDRIEEMYNRLRTEYDKHQESTENMRREKESLKKELFIKEDQNLSLNSKVKDFSHQIILNEKCIKDLKDKYHSLEQDYSQINILIIQEQEKLTNEKKKSNALEEKYVNIQKENEQLQKEILLSKSKIKDLEKQEASLIQEKEVSSKEIQTLLEKYNLLEEEKESISLSLQLTYNEKEDLQEVKQELEKQLASLSTENEKALSQNAEFSAKLNECESQIVNLNKELDGVKALKKEGERRFEELLSNFRYKEQSFEDLRKDQQNLVNEKSRLEVEINQHKRRVEDAESKAQMAQQHLAKKVRETALLSEELEKKGKKNSELQQILTSTQSQIHEARKSAEAYLQEKKRLESILKDISNRNEAEIGKWESKYNQLHRQLQDSHLQNQELQKQKGKLDQLHSVLNNLMTSVSPAQNVVSEKPSFVHNLDTEHSLVVSSKKDETFSLPKEPDNSPGFQPNKEAEEHAIYNSSSLLGDKEEKVQVSQEDKHYQNLFDLGNHQTKFKKTFFD